MPVLARHVEAAGIPSVVVTMMPDVADALGAPRVVGVEFPFGHPFGPVHAASVQRRVLATALAVLSGGVRPATRVDVDIEWPVPRAEAYRSWQPVEASPIVAAMLERRGSERR